MKVLFQYTVFLLVGLLTAGIGEAINNFLIHWQPGNFIFAMGFYTVSLTIAFISYKFFFQGSSLRGQLVYLGLFGLGLGLIINEWLLVGNHPGNPNTNAAISQIAMVSFHSLLYFLPVLSVSPVLRWRDKVATIIKFTIPYVVCIVVVALQLGLPGTSDEYVLAWSIFFTYYVGYNLAFLYIVWHLFYTPENI